MSNQIQINGVPLTEGEISAIQLALQSQIEFMKDGISEFGSKLNDHGTKRANQLLQYSQTALSKIVTISDVYVQLTDEPVTDDIIKKYTK